MSKKLEGKIALITGGSRGIGAANRQASRGGWSEGGHHVHERRRRGRVGRQGD